MNNALMSREAERCYERALGRVLHRFMETMKDSCAMFYAVFFTRAGFRFTDQATGWNNFDAPVRTGSAVSTAIFCVSSVNSLA